jgi:hypothetical protein
VDAGAFGVFEGLCGDFDIFLYCAGQAADGDIFYNFRYFLDGMEVAGAGNGETGFQDIDAKGFEFDGQFDFLTGIEFAARDLFSVAEGGIKDEDFLV